VFREVWIDGQMRRQIDVAAQRPDRIEVIPAAQVPQPQFIDRKLRRFRGIGQVWSVLFTGQRIDHFVLLPAACTIWVLNARGGKPLLNYRHSADKRNHDGPAGSFASFFHHS
jgi:hypothetical protein